MRSMSVFLTDLGLVAALASDSRVLLHIAKKKRATARAPVRAVIGLLEKRATPV